MCTQGRLQLRKLTISTIQREFKKKIQNKIYLTYHRFETLKCSIFGMLSDTQTCEYLSKPPNSVIHSIEITHILAKIAQWLEQQT